MDGSNDDIAGREPCDADGQKQEPVESSAQGADLESTTDSEDLSDEAEDSADDVAVVLPEGDSARLARKRRLEARETERLRRVAEAASARRSLGSERASGEVKSAMPHRARGGAEQRRLARVAAKAAARRAKSEAEESRLSRVAQKAAARRARLAQGEEDPSASPEAAVDPAGSPEDDDELLLEVDDAARLQRLADKVALRRTAEKIKQLQYGGQEEDEGRRQEENEQDGDEDEEDKVEDNNTANNDNSQAKKRRKMKRRNKCDEEKSGDTGNTFEPAQPKGKKKKVSKVQQAEASSGSSSSPSSSSSDSSASSSSSASAEAKAIAKALATGQPVPKSQKGKKGKAAKTGALFAWESADGDRPIALHAAALMGLGVGAALPASALISPLASTQEVEQFLAISQVDGESGQRLRMLPANQQRLAMEKGPILGSRNPSSVLISRIRDIEMGRVTAPPQGFGALGAASSPTIEKFITQHNLDTQAAQAVRSLPPEKQKMVLGLGLDGARNPSAIVMTKLAEAAGTGAHAGWTYSETALVSRV